VSFPDLDPSIGNVHTVFHAHFCCTNGSSYRITMNMGLYEAGGRRRIKHEFKDSYIPYNLVINFNSGTGSGSYPISHILESDVYAIDIAGAPLGSYSDTIIITITPSY